MPLTADDARALAQLFSDASYAVDQYRFANWNNMTAADYQTLEDDSLQLHLNSMHLTTKAVGLQLNDMQKDLQAIKDATSKANNALKTIANVKKAIGIAASLVSLGGAILSENPSAILTAAQGVYTAVAA